jgi:alpha-tubulin suppressor-like RCC1 family protein
VEGVPAFTQISAGSWHTCGLSEEGEAWCWGSGGATDHSGSPAPVPGGYKFSSIGSGRYHNCALTIDGTAYCWSGFETGSGFCGQAACSNTPTAVGPYSFTKLAVGELHTCALDMAGAAICWGFNWMGETGGSQRGQLELEPVVVSGGLVFSEIGANHGYTCALTSEGQLYCWGWGEVGQLGVPLANLPICSPGPENTNVYCSSSPLTAATSLTFKALSVGLTHACALSDQDRAFCWGDNGQGQLGDSVPGIEQYGIRFSPGPTTNGAWIAIEAGGATTCGINTVGDSYCWGLNFMGLLATNGSAEISTKPVPIAGGHSFSGLSAGAQHMCGLTTDGETYCWGDNSVFQMGSA